MYKEIIEKIKPELEKALRFFEGELAKIRTSRISIFLVEDIKVNYLEEEYSLKELASISLESGRSVIIHPWDKSYIPSILKAIEQEKFSLTPVAEKDIIRLSTPPLSSEYREELFRILKEKKEDVRKTIRYFRDKAWDQIQEGVKTKEIREDDKFRGKEELQKLVDQYNKKIEEMAERKEKEIKE
ncbi:ribosome recycling factor [bacterium (Candidatus Gribaldobacteria) CG_4_9_14_3_um_filter_33_9]|nr:MAG: ribosome recycling factor [bacterium (Candidatus Gribaldobacteria) CG_4_9_14_3_um_filter_33_9]